MKLPESFRISSGPLGTSAANGNNGLFVIPRGNGSKQNLTVLPVKGKSGSTFRCREMLRTLSHALS